MIKNVNWGLSVVVLLATKQLAVCQVPRYEQWLNNTKPISTEWVITKHVPEDKEKHKQAILNCKEELKKAGDPSDVDSTNRIEMLKTALQTMENISNGYDETRRVKLYYLNPLRWRIDVNYDHLGKDLGITKIAYGNGLILTEDRGQQKYTVADNTVQILSNELIGVPDLYFATLYINNGTSLLNDIKDVIEKSIPYQLPGNDLKFEFSPAGTITSILDQPKGVLSKKITVNPQGVIVEVHSHVSKKMIFAEEWKASLEKGMNASEFESALSVKINKDYSLDIETKMRKEKDLGASALTLGEFSIENK